jgi:hypothetical protein
MAAEMFAYHNRYTCVIVGEFRRVFDLPNRVGRGPVWTLVRIVTIHQHEVSIFSHWL